MNTTAAARHLVFLLPGSLRSLTGGTLYDRHVVDGLRAAGWQVDVVTLDAGFPWPDAAAREHAAAEVAKLPDGVLVVADGLAFGAMAGIVRQHAQRLRWVALVHHPLALETGLDAAQAAQLRESERQALAAARCVVVTSRSTQQALAGYGVAADRIQVVEPGVLSAAPATGSARSEALSLLCVATLTPRKGHAVLLDALATLRTRAWTLHCVGDTLRDAATAAAVHEQIAALGLERRVFLHGALGAEALEAAYAAADVFVLPSFHEGYGMALAEALAHGLPVVSTTAGAIPDTVPATAGVLVPAGDTGALAAALARLLDDAHWRAALAAGARQAGARLPSWPQAVARFAAVLERMAAAAP